MLDLCRTRVLLPFDSRLEVWWLFQVGHQAGATIAILLADTWPNRVKKLVLWGVPIMTVMERGDFLREEPPDYHNEFLGTIMSFVSDRFPDDEHPWQLKVSVPLFLWQGWHGHWGRRQRNEYRGG